MSWREKIVLFLMGGVILYGVVDFGLRQYGKRGGGGRVAQETADAERSAERMRDQIHTVSFTPAEEQALAQLSKPWSPTILVDRLLPPKAEVITNPGDVAVAEAEQRPSLRYTGYFSVGGKRLALINGLEYGRGEPLSAGAYRVGAIEPEHVILHQSTSDKTWRLVREGGAGQ